MTPVSVWFCQELALRISRHGILETDVRKGASEHALVMVAAHRNRPARAGVRGFNRVVGAHRGAQAGRGPEGRTDSRVPYSGHPTPVRGDRHRHLFQHPATERRDPISSLKSIGEKLRFGRPRTFAFVESADTLCTEGFRVARDSLGPMEDATMTTDQAAPPWTLRSTLVAVGNLERSVAFYGELGPFAVIARDDAIAVLGDASPESIVLILRETRRASSGSSRSAISGPAVRDIQRRIARRTRPYRILLAKP